MRKYAYKYESISPNTIVSAQTMRRILAGIFLTKRHKMLNMLSVTGIPKARIKSVPPRRKALM